MGNFKKDLFIIELSDEKAMPGISFESSDLIISSKLKTHSNVISHYKLSSIKNNSFVIKLYLNIVLNKKEFENFVLKNFTFSCYNYEANKYLPLNIIHLE
jgi:hypothetical protein